MSELYNRIKYICEAQNLKITAMAQQAGVNPAMLSDLKYGRRKTMTLPTAQKIADFLNVSVDYLLSGDESIQKEKPATDEGDELSEDIKNIITLYRAASPEMKAAALGMLEAADKARLARDSIEAEK